MPVFNKKNKYRINQFHLYFIASLFLLNGCGGGGGGSTTPVVTLPTTTAITGAGVKGPLANAKVIAYELDTTKTDLKGVVIGSGTTDVSAQIVGLTIPTAKIPPFILEFTSDVNTTDITTGQAPVITTLRTVLTQGLVTSGNVYASLQTTMATDIAIANADSNTAPYSGDNNGTITGQELLNALPIAASQVMSTFGFGATSSVDIFTTPPLITATTVTDAQQKTVAEYRTAIEALTALVFELGKNVAVPTQTAEAMLVNITADLMDGTVDGMVNGIASTIIDAAVLNGIITLDPSVLPIPNSDNGTGTPYTVGQVEIILVAEKAITGSTTPTTNLGNGTIVVTPAPAKTDPDTDKDTIVDFIDNCPLKVNTNQSDTNNNGVGDVCDNAPVAVNDGITVDEGASVTLLDSSKLSVLANDTDVEGDTLTVTLITGPGNATTFTLNADGTFSYQHNGSETLSDSFTYQVSDGTSNSATNATVSIVINPINDLPIAVDDTINVLEGGTVTVLTDAAITPAPVSVFYNDTDAENDPLTATVVNQPVNAAAFSLNSDGTFSYQHNASQTTSDSFTYSVFDGTGNSLVDATVTISITPVNNNPILKPDVNNIKEDAVPNTVSGDVLMNDFDVDTAKNLLQVSNTVVLNSSALYGTLTIGIDGKYNYSLDNTNATVNALNNGEVLTEIFNYTVSDGSGGTAGSTLTITVNGTTDTPVVGVDMSGVWQITSTVQSVTPPPASAVNCETVGNVSTTYATIKQTGTALDIKTHLGASYTGTIDTTTGVFSIPTKTFTRQIADLSQPANGSAALVNYSETITASGTTVSQTSISNGSISTSRIVGGIPAETCDYTESFTAVFLYKHTGTEQYNGIYADESSIEAYYSNVADGVYPDKYPNSFTLEYEINGASLKVYIPGFNSLLPTSTSSFSNLSFDPSNGYFSGNLNLDLKVDTNGDGSVNINYVSNKILSGIFIRPPTKNIDGTLITGGSEGANGTPIAAVSLFGYNRIFLGDKTIVAQEEVSIEAEDSYQKRLVTEGQTRIAIIEKGDKTLQNQVKIGLINPPLKKNSSNSKLYLEVLDSAKTPLCSVPYRDENGLVNRRYFRNVNLPDPVFNSLNFRGRAYSVVNCKLLPPASNATNVIIQIRDTGADGLKGGIAGTVNEDKITVINSNYIPEVFTPAYTQVIPVSSISVNGATVSSTATGNTIPLLGYFDFTDPTRVTWPKHPETTVNYQLRYEKVSDPDAIKYRYRVNANVTPLNATIQGYKLKEGSTIRVVAFNKTSTPGSGAIAQSFTRRISIVDGINGLFDVDLSKSISNLAYQTMRLSLSMSNGSVISCSVIGNSNMSCGTEPSSNMNRGLDTIDLTMTDVTGNLIGVGSTFIITLHFKVAGVITSNSAIVTSTNASTGIPATVNAAFPASAKLFNP